MTAVSMPHQSDEQSHHRPGLTIGSAAEMTRWLRDNLGRGQLAGIVRVHGFGLLAVPGLSQDRFEANPSCRYVDYSWLKIFKLTPHQLVGLVDARWDCRTKSGRAALLPVAAARVVIAAPYEAPGVRQLDRICMAPHCRSPLGWDAKSRTIHSHGLAVDL